MNKRDDYTHLPPDLWPRRIHVGRVTEKTLSMEEAVSRREAPPGMGNAIYLTRNLVSRPVTITTSPTLILRSGYAWPYIILNPSTSVGLTTTVTGYSGTASNGDTSSSVGVAGFQQAHMLLNVTGITGGDSWDIYLQAYDSINSIWADSQALFTGITATGSHYAFPDAFGIGTDIRFRFDRTAGAGNLTCTIGIILKNGVGGTIAGLSQAIYLGGPGVTTVSGYPLLEGEDLRLIINEGVELYGIAETNITIRVFEL
jgi:hypothetical protein